MKLHDYLEYWARSSPNRPCASDDTRSFTFHEIDMWADRVAAFLASLGVGDNDRFGVLAKNCCEWLAIYYGAFKLGAVPVPLNFRLHPREWAYLLNDSGAVAILAQDRYVEQIDGLGDDLSSRVKARVVIDGERSGWLSLASGVAEADPAKVPDVHIEPDHDAWQMYTSGTTGLPKGAVLTHTALAANMMQLRTAAPVRDSDKRLVVMPLFHAGAALGVVQFIAAGAEMRIKEKFDAAECVGILETEKITQGAFVPAMIQSMLAVPGVGDRQFPHLRTISYGASPIPREVLGHALAVFDCGFQQGFGQTESSAGLTVLDIDAHRRALAGEAHLLGSCGRALPGTEVVVVDDDGARLPPGQRGEIRARGPQMMRAYWNLPEATAQTIVDGWLHTGDVGHIDEEGFLYISGRLKDMIVSGGENIYPREIEEVIHQLAGVADVAVIGVPDDQWGETPKAIVALKPGVQLSEADVVTWCRDRLATYKAPRSVDFVETLPRNPSGKVLKRELREPYWAARDRQVG